MTADATPADSTGRARLDLFLISLLILFLELACIRWFPAHVLFLTFFTNTVLLACFLGMSLGCLAASHKRNYLTWTPLLLLLSLAVSVTIELMRRKLSGYFDVASQAKSPAFVFFGTESVSPDPGHFIVPIEVVGGFFFLLLTLMMVGPGQELGRALTRLPNRIQAYTINILGSLVGILLFAGFSWGELPPVFWFLPVVLGIGYFLLGPPARSWAQTGGRTERVMGIITLVLVLVISAESLIAGPVTKVIAEQESVKNDARASSWLPIEFYWSPYYRIDYFPKINFIDVNLIGHQQMVPCSSPYIAYELPFLWNRDSGGQPFKDVLIIGAGSGNDVSRALQWGTPETRIDAVEIDPRIQALGKRDHPDHPYDDKRVNVTINDGRNFLRSTDGKYDLVIFALVDSLVLHSGYSNLRMESYLFTKEAMADVQKHLKPGGVFVMYNYFRQGWIVARLKQQIEEVFHTEPLVLPLSFEFQPKIEADEPWDAFTVLIAGEGAQRFRAAFNQRGFYWLRKNVAAGPQTPDGFSQQVAAEDEHSWYKFKPVEVVAPAKSLLVATDNWPFLYLREPMIPVRPSLTGAAVMLGIALVLLLFFLPRSESTTRGWGFDGRMFFLGAGFMLVETKAVVQMALLEGSTWRVNSIVFFAVLVMILLANLFVLKMRPGKVWPYYVGLLVTLALNALVPLDFFLGMERLPQLVYSCLLVFAPILFAGVIFAISFARTAEADRAFGANIAGAMVGGLAEYSSMLLGFQNLMLLAIGLYVLSMFGGSRGTTELAAAPKQPEPVEATL
jgi:SAM-dependent methyltransferase